MLYHLMHAIILAAGASRRFKTSMSKLAHTLCGQPMLIYTTQIVQELTTCTTIVLGHQREQLMLLLKKYHAHEPLTIALQEQQLGTGHAVACTQQYWTDNNILILNGDMPLIQKSTLQELISMHLRNNATISFVTAQCPDLKTSLGRVVQENNIITIVEAKDFTHDPAQYTIINAGIYIMARSFVEQFISQLNTHNASKEFYVTDLIKIAAEQNFVVQTLMADYDTIRGVNTLEELAAAEALIQQRILTHHMLNGVRIIQPHTVQIDRTVTIGSNSVIYPGVHLTGNTHVGEHCTINPYAIIHNSMIPDNSIVETFTLMQSHMSSAHPTETVVRASA